MKKWAFSEFDKSKIKEFSAKYQLPVFTAILLYIRGFTEQDKIDAFFDMECSLPDPYSIKDMDKAVTRITKAVNTYEKICVYGDYDCDGVTATALLYSYFESIGANVIYYIPDRNSEGYGINKKAIDFLKNSEVSLIVTVDNGISAIDEVFYAQSLGIDVVVTDHHKPQDILPAAVAVVDPHRLDDTSAFRDYCGAGIALLLATALEGDSFSVLENYSDLAALGTVADLVPLSGYNRSIVKAGIIHLNNTERPGITELNEIAQIDKVNAGNIGFKLGPRINAAGRLDSPYDALSLLLSESPEESRGLAEHLNELNSKRQSIENRIYEDIMEMLKNEPSLTYDRVLVVSSDQWNAGVVGIVASKVTEKLGKPCIIICEDDEICKASGRSVSGFSIVDAIFACSDLLVKFGGHPMAAGLSLKREKIRDFRKAINAYADKLEYMPLPLLKIDCSLRPGAITVDMVKQLQPFEPFGYGNPRPTFALKGMKLEQIVPLSGGKHIKLLVTRDNARLGLVMFSVKPDEFPYPVGSLLDFALSLDLNVYRQIESVSFNVKDIRPADFDTEKVMLEMQLYEQYQKGIIRKDIKDKYPTRDDFAAVYRYFKGTQRSNYTIVSVLSSMGNTNVGAFRLLMILDIMNELKLINYSRDNEELSVGLANNSVKVDLNNSAIYGKLKEDVQYVRENT